MAGRTSLSQMTSSSSRTWPGMVYLILGIVLASSALSKANVENSPVLEVQLSASAAVNTSTSSAVPPPTMAILAVNKETKSPLKNKPKTENTGRSLNAPKSRKFSALPAGAGGLFAAAAAAGLGLYHGLSDRTLTQQGNVGNYVQDKIGQFLDFVSPSGGDHQPQSRPPAVPNAQSRASRGHHPGPARPIPDRQGFMYQKRVTKRGIPRGFRAVNGAPGLRKFHKPYGKLQNRQFGYGPAYRNYFGQLAGSPKANLYGSSAANLFGAGFPGLSQDSDSVETLFMTTGKTKGSGKKYGKYRTSGLKAAKATSDSGSGERKYIPNTPSIKYYKGAIVKDSSEESGKYPRNKGRTKSKTKGSQDDSNSSEILSSKGQKYLKHLKHIGHHFAHRDSNEPDNSDDAPCNGNCNGDSDSGEAGAHGGAAAGGSAAVFHGPNLGFNFEGSKVGQSSPASGYYGASNGKYVGASPLLHFYFFPKNSGEDVKQVIREQASLLKSHPPHSDENGDSDDHGQDDNSDDDNNGSSGTGDSSEPQFGGYYIVPPKKPASKYASSYAVQGKSKGQPGNSDSDSEEIKGHKQSFTKSYSYGTKAKGSKKDDSDSQEALQQPPPIYYLVETPHGKYKDPRDSDSDSNSKEQKAHKFYQVHASPPFAAPRPNDDSDSRESKPKHKYITKVTHTVVKPLPPPSKHYHHGHQDSESQESLQRPFIYSIPFKRPVSASKRNPSKKISERSSEEDSRKGGKSKQQVFVKLNPSKGYKIVPINSNEDSHDTGRRGSKSKKTAHRGQDSDSHETGFRPLPPLPPTPHLGGDPSQQPPSIQAYNVFYSTHPPQQQQQQPGQYVVHYATLPQGPVTLAPVRLRAPSHDSSSEERKQPPGGFQQWPLVSSNQQQYGGQQQQKPVPVRQPSHDSSDSGEQQGGLHRLKVEQQHSGYYQVNTPKIYGKSSIGLPNTQKPIGAPVYSKAKYTPRPLTLTTTYRPPSYTLPATTRPYRHTSKPRPPATLPPIANNHGGYGLGEVQKQRNHYDTVQVTQYKKPKEEKPYQSLPQQPQSYQHVGQLENVHQIIQASQEQERQQVVSIVGQNHGVDESLLDAHKNFGPQPKGKSYNHGEGDSWKPHHTSGSYRETSQLSASPHPYHHGPTQRPVLTPVPIWGEFPARLSGTTQSLYQTERPMLHKFSSHEAKDLRSSEEIQVAFNALTKQEAPGKAVHYQTSKQSGFSYTTIVDHSQRRNADVDGSNSDETTAGEAKGKQPEEAPKGPTVELERATVEPQSIQPSSHQQGPAPTGTDQG